MNIKHAAAQVAVISVAALGWACVNELPVEPLDFASLEVSVVFVDSDTNMVGKTDTVLIDVARNGVPITGLRARFASLDPTALNIIPLPVSVFNSAEDSIRATMQAEVTYLKRGLAAFRVFFDSLDVDVVDSGDVGFDVIQERWQSVSAGDGHTCAVTLARVPFDSLALPLRQGGEVFCWGTGDYGALGTGFSEQERFPRRARTNEVFNDVRAGERFSCGTDQIGLMYCWGDNLSGQLGLGNQLDQFVPRLTAQAEAYTSYEVSQAGLFTCGAKRTSVEGGVTVGPGFTYCWGQNDLGQLGCGDGPDCDPLQLTQPNTAAQTVVIDQSTGLPNRFIQVTTGGNHACGMDGNGNVSCWGDNTFGQLGTDPVTPMSRASIRLFDQFTHVSAGRDFTCALGLTLNEVSCWGRGIGGNPDSFVPVPVAGLPGDTVAILDAGANHACVVMLNADAYCWGENGNGQLGDNTTQSSASAVLVSGNHSFVGISSGTTHTCGIAFDAFDIPIRPGGGILDPLPPSGALYCWGGNDSGQLGNVDLEIAAGSPIPVRVSEPIPFFF